LHEKHQAENDKNAPDGNIQQIGQGLSKNDDLKKRDHDYYRKQILEREPQLFRYGPQDRACKIRFRFIVHVRHSFPPSKISGDESKRHVEVRLKVFIFRSLPAMYPETRVGFSYHVFWRNQRVFKKIRQFSFRPDPKFSRTRAERGNARNERTGYPKFKTEIAGKNRRGALGGHPAANRQVAAEQPCGTDIS
jgi:hypothetical protein